MLPRPGRKEDSVNLVLRIRNKMSTKHDALDVMILGIINKIVLNLERTRGKREEAHVSEIRGELDAKEI